MSSHPPSPRLQSESSGKLEEILLDFARSLRQGLQPRISDYLERPGIERRALLQKLVSADLEFRLKAQEPCRIENYLATFPDLRQNCEDVLELVRVEYELRRISEPSLAWEEYALRFPEFKEAIEKECRTPSTLSPADAESNKCQLTPLSETISDPRMRLDNAAGPREQRYKPLRFHAKGGLGEVFVAEDIELNREVALKRIQLCHSENPESRRRFLMEAEITGRLEHPGIVPVYGLVHDGQGQPSYAMRFVEGENLNEAIRRFHAVDMKGRDLGEFSLGLRHLLGQFIAVCNAVAYAHSRGILHRDLKPSNIMLGKYGETLVVDWGLAKTVERDAAARATGEKTLSPKIVGELGTETELGEAIGTPAYMSPEQATGEWDWIGPASDIYSLGATLYAILTGKAPFRGTARDIQAQVQRGSFLAPRQCHRNIPRALEAICLKAMALKPDNRYATALELAADVEHWLADEPVAVYRESPGTRIRRWAKRHKVVVSGGVVLIVAAALALPTGVLLINRQRERADENFALAIKALDGTVTKLVADKRLGDPGFQTLRKDLLESTVPLYEKLSQQKQGDATVEEHRGRAYQQLAFVRAQMGDTKNALDDYEHARSAFEELADRFPSRLEYRHALAWIHIGRSGLFQNRRDSERALCSAVEICRKLVEESPNSSEYYRVLSEAHIKLGNLYQDVGEAAAAEREDRKALETLDSVVLAKPESEREDRTRLAITHRNLGSVLADLGRYSDAESEFKRALYYGMQLVEEFPAERDYRQDLAHSHAALSNFYSDLGKYADADSELRTALRTRQELATEFGNVPEYRREFAQSRSRLGQLLTQRGLHQEARDSYRLARDLLGKLASEFRDTPLYQQELIAAEINYAASLHRSGEHEQAAEVLRTLDKQTGRSQGLPEHRLRLAESYRNLGNSLSAFSKGSDDSTAYEEALGILQRLLKEFPEVPKYRQLQAETYNGLGESFSRLLKRADAKAAYNRALDIEQQLNARFPDVPAHAIGVGATYIKLAQLIGGERNGENEINLYGKAIEQFSRVREKYGGEAVPARHLRDAHLRRAESLTRVSRYDEAFKDWDYAVKLTKDSSELEGDLGSVRLKRALAYTHAGLIARAVAEAKEAIFATAPGLEARLQKGLPGHAYYDAAHIYARASITGKVPSEEYARLAVGLLQLAFQTEDFKDPLKLAEMTDDKTLDTLRVRRDYKLLVGEIYYDVACTHAAECAVMTDRVKQSETAEKAIASLVRAYQAGFFNQTSNLEKIKRCDDRLHVLREREGYKTLEPEIQYAVACTYATKASNSTDDTAEFEESAKEAVDHLKSAARGGFFKTANKLLDMMKDGRLDSLRSGFHFPDFEATLWRATIEEQATVVASRPNDRDARRQLARSHYNLGVLLLQLNDEVGAEAAHRTALRIQHQLVQDFASFPAYRSDLAETENALGIVLVMRKQFDADSLFNTAVQTRERLVKEYPSSPSYLFDLANSYINLGTLAGDSSNWKDALNWYGKAINALGAIGNTQDRSETAQLLLRNSYWGRAEALANLKRYSEAAENWGRADQFYNGRKYDSTLLKRSKSVSGSSQQLRAEFDDLRDGKDKPNGTLYLAAQIHALAADAIKDSRKTETFKQYKKTAIGFLKLARQADYFRNLAHLAEVQSDHDLDAIRSDKEFIDLMQELRAKNHGGK